MYTSILKGSSLPGDRGDGPGAAHRSSQSASRNIDMVYGLGLIEFIGVGVWLELLSSHYYCYCHQTEQRVYSYYSLQSTKVNPKSCESKMCQSDMLLVASFGHQTETTILAMVQGVGAPLAQLAATMVSDKLQRA